MADKKKKAVRKKVEDVGRIVKAVPARPMIPTPPVKTLHHPEELNLFACPNCGKVHFRHAGYLETALPYQDNTSANPKVATDERHVKICVSCKHAYITYDAKIWDVTKFIDLEAWEKTEKEAHKATGPGGQC